LRESHWSSRGLSSIAKHRSRIGARLAQRGENIFRRDIATRCLLANGNRQAPSARRQISCNRCIRREYLFFYVLRPAVQMHSQFDAGNVVFHVAKQAGDDSGVAFPAYPQAIGTHANVPSASPECLARFPRPGFVIGIAEAIEM